MQLPLYHMIDRHSALNRHQFFLRFHIVQALREILSKGLGSLQSKVGAFFLQVI
jgi:hypothetical protein